MKVGWSSADYKAGGTKTSSKVYNKVQGLGYGGKQGFYLHQCTQNLLSQKSWVSIRT